MKFFAFKTLHIKPSTCSSFPHPIYNIMCMLIAPPPLEESCEWLFKIKHILCKVVEIKCYKRDWNTDMKFYPLPTASVCIKLFPKHIPFLFIASISSNSDFTILMQFHAHRIEIFCKLVISYSYTVYECQHQWILNEMTKSFGLGVRAFCYTRTKTLVVGKNCFTTCLEGLFFYQVAHGCKNITITSVCRTI